MMIWAALQKVQRIERAKEREEREESDRFYGGDIEEYEE